MMAYSASAVKRPREAPLFALRSRETPSASHSLSPRTSRQVEAPGPYKSGLCRSASWTDSSRHRRHEPHDAHLVCGRPLCATPLQVLSELRVRVKQPYPSPRLLTYHAPAVRPTGCRCRATPCVVLRERHQVAGTHGAAVEVRRPGVDAGVGGAVVQRVGVHLPSRWSPGGRGHRRLSPTPGSRCRCPGCTGWCRQSPPSCGSSWRWRGHRASTTFSPCPRSRLRVG